MVVEIDRASLSKREAGDTRIPICLSSEEPVSTWYGKEILLHSAEAIDMTYAKNGLPFFADHEYCRQVGWIEDVTLDSDARLRGMLSPTAHPDAGWVFEDIRAGRRPYTSVDYMILEARLAASDEQGDTWEIPRWQPVGCSSVPIPADVTVGIGRSAERAATPVVHPATVAQPTMERAMETAAPAVPAPAVASGPSLETRNAELAEIANLAAQHNMLDRVSDWAQRGLTRDQVAGEILTRQRGSITPTPKPAGDLDLSTREQKQYSLGRAILAAASGDWSKAGFEREASLEVGKRMGRAPNGFYVPLASLSVPMPAQRASLTGQTAGTNADGGYSVQTTVMPLIELLRNRMFARKLGAKVYTGLTDTVQFPRQITANTFGWLAENPSSGAALTKLTMDTVTLSPKIGMARTAFSRRLLTQSSIDVQGTVEADLAEICAHGMDAAAIAGLGSSNQPTGVLYTTGVNLVAIGTDGGAMTRAKVLEAIEAIAIANADVNVQNWLFTPEVRTDLKTTAKIGSTYPVFLWGDDNTVEGYSAFVTNQLPKTLTKGATSGSCHAAILGVWDQLIIGEFGGTVDLQVNPYTYEDQGMIATTAYLQMDVGVRHPAAFSVFKDLTT